MKLSQIFNVSSSSAQMVGSLEKRIFIYV